MFSPPPLWGSHGKVSLAFSSISSSLCIACRRRAKPHEMASLCWRKTFQGKLVLISLCVCMWVKEFIWSALRTEKWGVYLCVCVRDRERVCKIGAVLTQKNIWFCLYFLANSPLHNHVQSLSPHERYTHINMLCIECISLRDIPLEPEKQQ